MHLIVFLFGLLAVTNPSSAYRSVIDPATPAQAQGQGSILDNFYRSPKSCELSFEKVLNSLQKRGILVDVQDSKTGVITTKWIDEKGRHERFRLTFSFNSNLGATGLIEVRQKLNKAGSWIDVEAHKRNVWEFCD